MEIEKWKYMIIYFNEYLDELLMQEDLLDILPMVEEANAISQELDRKVIIRQLLICQLAVRARQLASVAQLVRALHWNHRATGSIPVRGLIVAFFATAPG